MGLTERAFLVCDCLKRMWREAHPAIAGTWKELDTAMRRATVEGGKSWDVGEFLKVTRTGAWLRLILPSGRSLCYPSPRIEEGKISYMGVDPFSKKWKRIFTYGGKVFENANQAIARDVMTHNMPLIEAAGYKLILTVHDEVITEAPDDTDFNPGHLSSLLAANPPWALKMPLAAKGFETYRYRKG